MAVMLAEEDEAGFLARAQQMARDEGVYMVMPIGEEFEGGREQWENKLYIVDPSGEIVLEHHKYGNYADEGYKPGDGILRTIETPFGVSSAIICNDTNHQEVVAQAGRNGTQILFAPKTINFSIPITAWGAPRKGPKSETGPSAPLFVRYRS